MWSTALAFLSGIGGKILGAVTLIFGIFMSGALVNRSKQKRHHQKRDMKDLKKQYKKDGEIREKTDREVMEDLSDKFS